MCERWVGRRGPDLKLGTLNLIPIAKIFIHDLAESALDKAPLFPPAESIIQDLEMGESIKPYDWDILQDFLLLRENCWIALAGEVERTRFKADILCIANTRFGVRSRAIQFSNDETLS